MKPFTGRVLRAIEPPRAPARTNEAWGPAEIARLEALWKIHGGKVNTIAKIMGRTKGSISGKSRVLGLQFAAGRAIVLTEHDPAAWFSRTMFESRVMEPGPGVLKSGDNQRKLGKVVTKGPLAGAAIYSLTLEERHTCPRQCKLWLSCYGNNMGLAKRYREGPALMRALWSDLATLSKKHPEGFLVRLHILGDFYSVGYVEMWREALAAFRNLYVFGYTAWQRDTEIGAAVAKLRGKQWRRFAVRTSGAKTGPRTMVVSHETSGAIMCPAQTGKTKNCGTCGLCWAESIKSTPIAFLQH